MDNNTTKNSQLPFDSSELMSNLNNSSRRSRQVFVILLFASALILISLMNTLKPSANWYRAKVRNHQILNDYFLFPDDTGRGLNSLSKYIFENEKLNDTPSIGQESLMKFQNKAYTLSSHLRLKFPQKTRAIISENIDVRLKEYQDIASAIKYSNENYIFSKEYVQNELYILQEGTIEHIEFVKVPILGVTFHSNFLGVFGGIVILVLYIILNYCLLSEYTNTVIVFRGVANNTSSHPFYFYEYNSMQQVLFRPEKLFKPSKSKFFDKLHRYTHKHFFTVGIYIPYIIYCFVVLYDAYSFSIGCSINKDLTIMTMAFEIMLLILTGFYFYETQYRSSQIDWFWLNVALDLNFEFILGKISEKETTLDKLVEYKESDLSNEDKVKLKLFWYKCIEAVDIHSFSIKRTRRRVMKAYRKFINDSLEPENIDKYFKRKKDDLNKNHSDKVEKCWQIIIDLFEEHLDKKLHRNFRKVLTNRVVDFKS